MCVCTDRYRPTQRYDTQKEPVVSDIVNLSDVGMYTHRHTYAYTHTQIYTHAYIYLSYFSNIFLCVVFFVNF